MNTEAIETANAAIAHTSGKDVKVTARDLLAHVRKTDSVYLHGRAAYDRPSYSDAFVFTCSAKRSARAGKRPTPEVIATLDVPGSVRNGTTSDRVTHTRPIGDPFGREWVAYETAYRPVWGYWSLFGAHDRLVDVLSLLPKHAEVSFSVVLDWGTQEYLIRAECAMSHETSHGLHADYLMLDVRIPGKNGKEERRMSFVIDHTVIPHNSARFGSPRNESDPKGRID